MWTNEHYGQTPKYRVNGLTLSMQAWELSYGAEDPKDPNFVSVSLAPIDISFQQSQFGRLAKLYVVPSSVSPDHYYLTEWSTDPVLAETENPPVERWNAQIACIHCLTVTIPAIGTGSALIVEPNKN